jgi:hypothetical protein
VVVLLGTRGSAARYALGHDLAGRRAGRAWARMALAQRIAREMNPWCGGTVARFGLLADAQRRGVRRSCWAWPVMMGQMLWS